MEWTERTSERRRVVDVPVAVLRSCNVALLNVREAITPWGRRCQQRKRKLLSPQSDSGLLSEASASCSSSCLLRRDAARSSFGRRKCRLQLIYPSLAHVPVLRSREDGRPDPTSLKHMCR